MEGFGEDVTLVQLVPHVDARGRLVEFDFDSLPFTVRRAFAVAGVPAGTERGGHTHRTGTQLLVCLAGRIDVELRKDSVRHELTLTPAAPALRIAPGVWSSQRYVDEGSVLLVLASEPFDPSSYEEGT
jgi:dTDP-4-dehydrorhamnose 3,5-epimerase-like enzyme